VTPSSSRLGLDPELDGRLRASRPRPSRELPWDTPGLSSVGGSAWPPPPRRSLPARLQARRALGIQSGGNFPPDIADCGLGGSVIQQDHLNQSDLSRCPIESLIAARHPVMTSSLERRRCHGCRRQPAISAGCLTGDTRTLHRFNWWETGMPCVSVNALPWVDAPVPRTLSRDAIGVVCSLLPWREHGFAWTDTTS